MSVRIAYFFVPLAEPLGVPNGYVFQSLNPANWTNWEHEVVASAPSSELPEFPEPALRVSVCFHQADKEISGLAEMDALMRVARRALPASVASSPDHAEGKGAPPIRGPLTVAEVAAVLDEPGPKDEVNEGINRALSEAFDRGLAAIRVVQQAHHIATGRPIVPCVREKLPMFLPFAMRTATEGEAEPIWPEAVSLFITRLDPSHVRVEFDAEQRRLLEEAYKVLGHDRPFRTVPSLRNSAMVALDSGEYMQAVILAATAAEVMLGDLLSHLLWEECMSPEEAAELVVRPYAVKVKAQYHARLGGNWDPSNAEAVGEYERYLRHLRHRAVHAGAEPTIGKVHRALAAAADLESFVGDRLAANVRRYPITALAFCGPPGLERRGSFTRFVQDLMDDPTEPPWAETFGRWRAALDWCLRDLAGEGDAPDLSRSTTVVVVQPDGAVLWWRVDREAGVACAARVPEVTEGQQSAIEHLLQNVRREPLQGPLSAMMRDLVAEPLDATKWVRVDQALPLHSVMRDRSDLSGVPRPSLISTGRPTRQQRSYGDDNQG